jgi:predicted RNase H-like HicB family nuclease
MAEEREYAQDSKENSDWWSEKAELSYPLLDPSAQTAITDFLSQIAIIGLDDEVKDLAIRLRRQYQLKLPDAIVAATALSLGASLLTNDSRLHRVPGLSADASNSKSVISARGDGISDPWEWMTMPSKRRVLLKREERVAAVDEATIRLHIEALEEGGYLATSPDVPGLVAEGRSITEAVEIAQGLTRKILESCLQHGDPVPPALAKLRKPPLDLLVPVGVR